MVSKEAVIFLATTFLSMPVISGAKSVAENVRRHAVEATALPTSTLDPEKWCYPETPCGWLIYTPLERSYVSFEYSICKCQEGFKCDYAFDNLSIAAIVYLCQPNYDVASVTSFTNSRV